MELVKKVETESGIKMEMDKYVKDLELIFKNNIYALYVNCEANEVSVLHYLKDDLCTIPLTDLGKLLFEE